jgi:ketosteroid isomerase-like protein
MPDSMSQEDVLDWFSGTVRAYESGDEGFFDYFARDVSVFNVSSPTRIDGIEVYKSGFAPYFLGTERVSQVLSPEVRILGPDSALISFHNRILVKGIASNIRGTVVIQRQEDGRLAFVHIHYSPLSQATAPILAPTDLENITVLEERVAAASAMTGTPK